MLFKCWASDLSLLPPCPGFECIVLYLCRYCVGAWCGYKQWPSCLQTYRASYVHVCWLHLCSRAVDGLGPTLAAMNSITKASIVIHLLYTSPPWWGMMSSVVWLLLEHFLCKLQCLGFLSAVVNYDNHVLRPLFPPIARRPCDLRPRLHNFTRQRYYQLYFQDPFWIVSLLTMIFIYSAVYYSLN